MKSGQTALKWIDDNVNVVMDAAHKIWEFAEVSLRENQSAELLAELLEQNDFRVKRGVGGMPTAFTAEWGQGSPRIGFLAEYDALPHMSQMVSAKREPVTEGAGGHGCQHNLLGAGCLGAVLAMQAEMKQSRQSGTIIFYGCPAEETIVGKIFMARDGLFDDLDAAITWHPATMNMVMPIRMLAVNSVKFTFHGKTAHAAADPHNGRSALDAVELMNIGANYLREHISTDARLHYSITNGGGEPNVVPAEAQVWYYVRAPRRSEVEDVYARLKKIAEGAALMTETSFDIEFLSGAYDLTPNITLSKVMADVFQEVGAPQWDDDDLAFASQLTESFDPGMKEASLRQFGMPPAMAEMLLHDSVFPLPPPSDRVFPGSSDVGDVSYIVPTVLGSAACAPLGSPAHSWQNVAAGGSAIGFKGASTAAKVMAVTALRLLEDPDLVEQARNEHAELTSSAPYKSPLPEGQKPPFDQFEG